MLAYLVLILTIVVFVKCKVYILNLAKKWLKIVLGLVLLQVTLGILTLLNVDAGIPLFYGVAHQLVGLLFFISILFLYFSLRTKKA